MALITQKSKGSNTYRFKAFSERVAEIDIRRLALYHIGHVNEELPEDDETYFHQTLKKWTVLNLSDEFTAFSRKCMKIVTLPQLMHEKNVVIDLLLERLATATTLSLQPLLELLYVMARDLREEFYPYFQRVLDRLICLLCTQDAEQLEWTLVCLAYLFKSLKPYLKKNIGVVFHAILPLLDDQYYGEHVTNFAVECFAFIARDVRDYRKFLDFMLTIVARKHTESVLGCGRLLFEIVRGIKGQFHSVANEFLPFIFAYVSEGEGPQRSEEQSALLCEIVSHAVENMLQFVHPKQFNLFWTQLCAVTRTVLEDARSIAKLSNLLTIYLIAAAHNEGRWLCELDVIVPTVLQMLDACMKAQRLDELQQLAQLVGLILLASTSELTQLDTSRLLKKILTVSERDIYDNFVLSIVTHTQFDVLILPGVLHYFEQHCDERAFDLLAQVVLQKSPLAANGIALAEWRPYTLQLKKAETRKHLQSRMKRFNITDGTPQQVEQQLTLLILLPHFTGIECDDAFAGQLQKETQSQLQLLQASGSVAKCKRRAMHIVALLVETQIHLDCPFNGDYLRHVIEQLLPYSADLRALSTLDQLLVQRSAVAALRTKHEEVVQQLVPHLSSHAHEVRLIVAHCLQTLHATKPQSPYAIFYAAECIVPDIQTYREQLLQLQKLQTGGELFKSYQQLSYKLDTVRFLLGVLHYNFKFVWEAVQQLLGEYAKALEVQQFWEVFHPQLLAAADAVNYAQLQGPTEPMLSEGEVEELWLSGALNALLPPCTVPALTQPQLLHYRNLLWQQLPSCGQLTEVKNRDLVTLVLRFVDEEYRRHLERREHMWNLQRDAARTEQPDDDDVDEEEEDDDDDGERKKDERNSLVAAKKQPRTRQQKDAHHSLVRGILQMLQYKLTIFTTQPNPKALHREPELHALYVELLSGGNAQLQRLALECIVAYKSKALTPHKELLYALSDERKFRDALIGLKLDDLVSAEARDEFMHVLLRVLYGKMHTRGTQRSVGAQARRGLILRFLGQCSSAEIFWFLRMAFGRYERYVGADVPAERIPTLVRQHFQLTAVWSARKLHAVVNLLELMGKEFGGLLDADFHLYTLKLLLFVGGVCDEVLRVDAALLHAKMHTVYRQLRQAALNALLHFDAHISDFAWTPPLVETVAQVFIWPSVARLPIECIHTPTPLLRLLLQWGERPQHIAYLQLRPPAADDAAAAPIFEHLIRLLLAEKAKAAVRKPIMALIERLLLLANAEGSGDQQAVALQLLRPYVPQVLQRLRMNLGTAAGGGKKRQRQHIDKQDLSILSLLTTHVDSPATCGELLQLLLPVLIAKARSSGGGEETICQVITTLGNLLRCLDTPELYLRQLAPLFEHVQEVAGRKLLCQLLVDIAKRRWKQAKAREVLSAQETALCERLRDTARLLTLLNAWDKRWVEQPDYERRLDSLRELRERWSDGGVGVDMDLGVLVIYNCFYFLRHDKDIGLRDNASEQLQLLLPALVRRYANEREELNYLVDDVFISLVRRLIGREAASAAAASTAGSLTAENARIEGIRLLGVMARECPQVHEVLADLAPLGNAQDPEVDFFENLVHLQTHRHGRALLKFCTHATTLRRAPAARTLTQFVLPLATRYLLQERYAGRHALVDAAIEAVGVACQLLPWQHYHAVLRYYLTRMRSSHAHQKQCVRIVVRILDAFHFDLQQAALTPEAWHRLREELKQKTNTAATADEVEVAKKETKQKPITEEQAGTEGDDEEAKNSSDLEEANSDDDDGDDRTDDDDAKDVEKENAPTTDVPQMKRALLLTPNAARRVLATISTVLIPTLNRSITEKSSYDKQHKVNRKRLSAEREEEEIQRVPIALALVKLMQKLPSELLETSLPGVFMKVCTFLRSPLKSVRMLTRDTLKKIMLTLGAQHLPLLMDHLQNLLTRGFQVHVLAVTVHGVLDALRGQLLPEHVEGCLGNLLDVALNDIFGEVTAQKDIDKLTAHTPEAKPSAKSYLVLHIAARNVREHCLLDLLLPFKEQLARSQARKTTLKLQECFAKIVSGLVENVHLSRESILVFIYGTMSESITDLLPGTQRRVLSEQERERMRRARPDCLLIPQAPRMRSGAVHKQVRTSAQANAHVLIEFGLEMLHIMLKRKKLLQPINNNNNSTATASEGEAPDYEYQPFLNPLLPLLRDALRSTHVRVTTFALRCYASVWNEGYELPALSEYLPDVVARLFEILKNFSTFGGAKHEDNLHLVKATFKALVALLRKCSGYRFSDEQLEQLVLQVDQDLTDDGGDGSTGHGSQATSFALLKAMLARRVDTPALHDTMKRVGDLSVTSTSDYVRDESRGMLLTYLLEYPLKKRLDQILKFFTVQLSYAVPSGRQSVIKLLHLIVRKLPHVMLAKRAELLYLSLAQRLVNDEDSGCRRAVAECLELLITRLERTEKQQLFEMTLVLLETPRCKPSVREMAAALCSRFLNAERQAFAPRIKRLLPLLVSRLCLSDPNAAGRFVRAPAMLGMDVDEGSVLPPPKKYKQRKAAANGVQPPDNGVAEQANGEEAMAAAIEEQQRAIDHEVIQLQYCLLKMFEYCSQQMFGACELAEHLDELAFESQKLLAHEHAWVRCNAAKTLTHIVAGYDFDSIGRQLSCGQKVVKQEKNGVEASAQLQFIYAEPERDIKSLVLDLCAQLVPGETQQAMLDEIVKIFLYIAHMLRDVPFIVKREAIKREHANGSDDGGGVAIDDDEPNAKSKINMNWLVRNIRFLINKEVSQAPHATAIRTSLFTLIEGLIALLSVVTLEKLGATLLALVVRETSEDDQNLDADLRQLALRVGSRLRKRIGADAYDRLRTQAQTKLMVRRAERKQLIAQEKIHDPVRAAKRKLATQERKKVAKKLKAAVVRGKAPDAKQKLQRRKRKAAAEIDGFL